MKSKRFMKPLTSPIHFHTAMIEQIPVAAFIGQEMIGSGKIVEITDFAVKIGDEFYMREACTFKYAGIKKGVAGAGEYSFFLS